MCGKSFERVGHLREHELIHLGVKPFICTLCGKAFMRVGHLRDHNTIHSGVKSFTCTICGKSFSRAGKLREHERYHSGVKPFTCTLCGKSFTTMGNQIRHERILCSDSYSCTTWGKSLTRSCDFIVLIMQLTCFTCSKSIAQMFVFCWWMNHMTCAMFLYNSWQIVVSGDPKCVNEYITIPVQKHLPDWISLKYIEVHIDMKHFNANFVDCHTHFYANPTWMKNAVIVKHFVCKLILNSSTQVTTWGLKYPPPCFDKITHASTAISLLDGFLHSTDKKSKI